MRGEQRHVRTQEAAGARRVYADTGWHCQLYARPTGACVRAGRGRRDAHFGFEREPRRRQRWIPVGRERMLSVEEGMLVEYDVPSRAPIGAVFLAVGESAC